MLFQGAGKQQNQHPLAAVGVGTAGSLLFLMNTISGHCFLCNSRVEHHITTTTGPLVYMHARHLDAAKLAITRSELFNALKSLGQSDSLWASPLHIVQKPGGGWSPCGDYCCLNC
ncbi:hypothetical protein LDENG_00018250 [Lucifuga dentata]|nr:hypothetical protein LDENG_00018250 [Lucifuga dentata]